MGSQTGSIESDLTLIFSFSIPVPPFIVKSVRFNILNPRIGFRKLPRRVPGNRTE